MSVSCIIRASSHTRKTLNNARIVLSTPLQTAQRLTKQKMEKEFIITLAAVPEIPGTDLALLYSPCRWRRLG